MASQWLFDQWLSQGGAKHHPRGRGHSHDARRKGRIGRFRAHFALRTYASSRGAGDPLILPNDTRVTVDHRRALERLTPNSHQAAVGEGGVATYRRRDATVDKSAIVQINSYDVNSHTVNGCT